MANRCVQITARCKFGRQKRSAAATDWLLPQYLTTGLDELGARNCALRPLSGMFHRRLDELGLHGRVGVGPDVPNGC